MTQNQSWSIEEDEVLKLVRPICSNMEISRVLKALGYTRTSEAVRKHAKSLGLRFMGTGDLPSGSKEKVVKALAAVRTEHPIPEPAPPVPVSSSKKAALTTSQRAVTSFLLEELNEIREEVKKTKSSYITSASNKKSLVVLLSDFHIGKVIKDEAGQVTYNMKIATDRIDQLRMSLWTLTSNPTVDEVVLVLAGDMVDGEQIYPGHEMNIETHVTDQIRAATLALWHLATDLTSLFRVRIVTCRGNHGKTGLSDEANWDNIIYRQLELLVDLEDNPDYLSIKNLYGKYNVFTVKGWKGLMRHQAPIQADTPSSIAKFAGWHSIHNYDFLMYGHYHHWGVMTWNGKPLFRNGSLGGGDDYAESFGAQDEPTQLAFLTSEETLVHSVHPIVLG